MALGLTTQALEDRARIRRDLEQATRHLQPLTLDGLHEQATITEAAKALYVKQQRFTDEDPFPWAALPPHHKQHWIEMARVAVNIVWSER